MRRRLLAIGIAIGLLYLWSGCSAPHSNPLDTASSHYQKPIVPPTAPSLTAHVRSVHISRIFPTTDSYSVVAELDGPDAELQDSAWVTFDGDSGVGLTWIAPNGPWSAVFAASYFGYPNMGWVVGRPFLFGSLNEDGLTYATGPVYVWRVIEDVPVLMSPTNEDTVAASPAFRWQAFDQNSHVDYAFGYQATVINITEGLETTVWTSALLPSTVLSLVEPDSLPLSDGDYYWTLTVQDSFRNTSRSKQGTFTVYDVTHGQNRKSQSRAGL